MERTGERRIVVIGATGFTGRLVAEELAGGAEPFVVAGRNAAKVRALLSELRAASGAGGGAGHVEGAVVDVRDPASLERGIRPGDVVINCAGPFAELGEPVVARCVEAGASYLDTTGEQPWMRRMRERYHDAAQAAGVAVVNGMAFEWALGDCAAALLGPLRSLDVVYAWGGTASSRGTRRTALRIMAERAWQLEDGRWRRRAAGARRRRFRLSRGARWAVTFGAGEVVTVPRWSSAETVRGWLVMSPGRARLARTLSPLLPVLMPLLRPLLEPLATGAPDPTPEERAASRFTIRLQGESPDGARRALEVRGVDPYGLTAAVAVAGARRAWAGAHATGVLAPSQLVAASSLLEGLSSRGLEVVPEP